MSYFIPQHVRSVHNEGGVVLLNLRSGAYFTLNTVGTLVWRELQGGGTREAALAALGRRFPVPEERLAKDVDALLARLIGTGLLALEEAPARGAGTSAASGEPARLVQAMRAPGVSAMAPERFGLLRRWLWSLLGYAALVGMDVLIRLAGFARFHRFVGRWRIRPRRAVDPRDAARISAAVDAASAFYFKRAWCLQRSAAATCLLRLRGFPAQLVIGVKRMPFLAHAWVEIEGRVVNDDPLVCGAYEEIERC
jgi:hypothetical protein